MKAKKLGARLASNRERQYGDRLAPATAWTHLSEREAAQAKRAVERLFASAAKRLGQLIRLEAGKVEVLIGANPGESGWADVALRSLKASSASLHWTLAIELSAHPFHQEWARFKQWARDQQLFVDARAELDPMLDRSVYLVRAWPLR